MTVLGDHRWLVFVLPGFLALFVAQFVSDLPEISDTRLPVTYIALTFISVSVPFCWLHVYGRIRKKNYTVESAIRSPAFLGSVFAFSLLVGLAFGMAHTTDYASAALRSVLGANIVPVSSQAELKQNLFKTINRPTDDFPDRQPYFQFADRNRYARFTFKEGRVSYEGSVGQYSGEGDGGQIYLSPGCIIENGTIAPVRGPGVWLNLDEVRDIQFVYSICSECALAIETAAGKQPPSLCPFRN
ncbi:hypothetical protein GOD41_30610 [Sinorhizobium medicae]|nr:hypothetical protein [Sinorhizobium medicae]